DRGVVGFRSRGASRSVEDCAEALGLDLREGHVDEGPHGDRGIGVCTLDGLPGAILHVLEVPARWRSDAFGGAGRVVTPEDNAWALRGRGVGPCVFYPLARRVMARPAAPHIRRQRVLADDAVVQ